MVGPVSGFISPNLTAPDQSQPLLPVDGLAQAIAALDARPSALVSAWHALSGAPPVDLKTAVSYSGSTPPAVVTDPNMLVRPVPQSDITVSPKSLDFSGSTTGFVSPAGTWANASFTVCALFYPTATAGCLLMILYDGANGPGVSFTSTTVQINNPYGGAAVSVPHAGKLVLNAPNFLVVCGDAASRTCVVYLNSKTPMITAAFGPTPWRTPTAGAGALRTNWAGGPAAAFPSRLTQGALFDRSLHHDAAAQPKLLNMIQAAADAYGIVLV